jgi:hypothetical protein
MAVTATSTSTARLLDGGYGPADNLGPPINTASGDDLPYVAPDESYLIFASHRPGGVDTRGASSRRGVRASFHSVLPSSKARDSVDTVGARVAAVLMGCSLSGIQPEQWRPVALRRQHLHKF